MRPQAPRDSKGIKNPVITLLNGDALFVRGCAPNPFRGIFYPAIKQAAGRGMTQRRWEDSFPPD
jgi:hypothetical protein